MKRFNARTLLGFSTEQLWNMLTGSFVLVFDDGEMEVTAKHALYSSYAWDFHRKYPRTPLLVKHCVKHVLAGKRLSADTHLELMGNAMWSVYDEYVAPPLALGQPLEVTHDMLAEMIYRQINLMYNDLTYRLEEYVVSLDITHFIEVLSHPRVKAANDNVQPTQRSIDETYTIIKDALNNGVDLPLNAISLAARSKLVNINQVLQCVAPRGYLTDTDSNLFRMPVLRGYAQGLRWFHDSLIESRSAAKSLIFSKTPLQQAEYFSRRLQLMSQIVRNLHHGDCGTTRYLMWDVKGPEIKNGAVAHGGDLQQLVGKHYVDDDGKLKTIKPEDRHLVGRTLKIRSPMHCAHPDPYGICTTCFGELSLSVPASTNIGHMCCTSMTQKSSQNVLSVKHLDGSSAVEGITLSEYYRRYLRIGSDDNSYLLAERLKGKEVMLMIPAERAANITDVKEAKNVDDLNITRISELDEIGLLITDDKGIDGPVELYVHLNRRLASLTYPMLHYIREHGWGVDEFGNYTIDMKDWDWETPFLTLPLKHFNMSDHSRDIANMLESSVDEMQERDKGIKPDRVLKDLFVLVNDKLSVNLAVLEVILYGAMITSAEAHDYSLPKPWTEEGLGVMKLSMMNRSVAAAMAFEGHYDVITSPLSYTLTNRPDHPMDGILMPYEVFEQPRMYGYQQPPVHYRLA